ncbi:MULTISPECIES: hypothetical protein [unclassified Gilliamella]|uniref:hypothetical protein n=1 Tax=unclassified Gilliamella TaxID=2685620 RepID=UPI0020B17824|nr:MULTISPECIES: hypothetical protein [unclassified Gilliamella]
MVCHLGPAGVFQSAGRGRRRRSRNADCGLFVRCVLRSGGVQHRSGSAGLCRWSVWFGFCRTRRSGSGVL